MPLAVERSSNNYVFGLDTFVKPRKLFHVESVASDGNNRSQQRFTDSDKEFTVAALNGKSEWKFSESKNPVRPDRDEPLPRLGGNYPEKLPLPPLPFFSLVHRPTQISLALTDSVIFFTT